MKIIISEAQMNYLVKNIELNDSENQLHQFKKELLFQYKIHELRLNMFEYDSEKENYLNSIKRTYTPYFKKNNTIISEYYLNFKSNLIVESLLTVNEKLKKYFNFISSSFLFEFELITKPQYFNLLGDLNNNLLVEYGWDDFTSDAASVGNSVVNTVKSGVKAVGNTVKSVGNTVYNTGKSVVNTVGNVAKTIPGAALKTLKYGANLVVQPFVKSGKMLSNDINRAWNYVKTKGIAFIMNGIRAALDSGVGTAVQTFLSFTGVGNIATAVVWGVMALYDLYMYIKGNVKSPLNLILSVLGAISTGALSPLLKSFKAGLSGNMSQIFTKLFAKLPVLKNWVTKIASGAGWLVNKMKDGAAFASKFLGITWLNPIVASGAKWISTIVKNMSGAMVLAKNTVKKVIQVLGSKMGTKVSEYLLTTAGKKMANTLSKATIQTINKELVVGKLKDSGADEVYAYVDKKYGKAYGNLIRISNGKQGTDIAKNLAKGNLS
jgi:hypothetical protein